MANKYAAGSKVQCSNCEQFGHTKVRCKMPPKESDAYEGHGYGGEAEEQPPQADDGYAEAAGGGDDW